MGKEDSDTRENIWGKRVMRVWFNLFILGINTRMSGGLQLLCNASGVSVPMIALYKLLGDSIEWSYPESDLIKVAHIEIPICL